MIPYLQFFAIAVFVSFILGLFFGLWLTRKFSSSKKEKKESAKEKPKPKPTEEKKKKWTVGKSVDRVKDALVKKKKPKK